MRLTNSALCRAGFMCVLAALAVTACAQVAARPDALVRKPVAAHNAGQESAVMTNQARRAAALGLTPRPVQIIFRNGSNTVGPDTPIVVSTNAAGALFAARHFIEVLARSGGPTLHASLEKAPASGAIVFELDPSAAVANSSGYVLDTGPGNIVVRARTTAGLYYGGVTLWQLLTPGRSGASAAQGTITVPAVHIEDWPRFRWRGLMLDSARHFQSVADIEKLLDWMSLQKLNVVHWHLTDDQGWRLEVPKYPLLTKIGACRKAVGPDAALTGSPDKPYCGFYTEADVRHVVAYAAARHITVVPEIDMPGHMQAAIAAYPWLGVTGERPPVSSDWGINTWLLKPDARTLKFVDDVMDEVMQLFPSKYIHIGGDEAAKDQWNASPAVRAHMHALGLKDMDALQGWFTTQVANYLTAHGRTAVGWDEILHGKVPASAVVMSWHEPAGALDAIEQGHDVVMASSPTLYLDHYQSNLHDEPPGRPGVESLQDVYDYNPIPAGATPAQAAHVLGMQANLWAEYMPTFARAQHAIFPRIAAWSETAWSPAATHDWHDFLARMPAELARYRALGIRYADSAFAPAFALSPGANGSIDVALSNRTAFGAIRYTTDGKVPTASSALYTKQLAFPAAKTATLRAATFAGSGFELSAPRTQVVGAAALRTRNSDQLVPCGSPGIVLRLEDDRPLVGQRPVYNVNIADMCWHWKSAPLDGVKRIALTVGNLPYNFALWNASPDVVVRPNMTPDGELQVHLDTCKGPTLAVLPLAPATMTDLQTTLTALIPATMGTHDLCIDATGDPRAGLWAIGQVRLLTH